MSNVVGFDCKNTGLTLTSVNRYLEQAWKRVRGEKGEKDITPLRGSGCMLPHKKNVIFHILKRQYDAFLDTFFANLGRAGKCNFSHESWG